MQLLNPAFMYAATWSFVLLLYSLRLSELLEPLRLSTVVLVLGTSLSFILGWVLECLPNAGWLATLKLDTTALGAALSSPRVARRLKTIWVIFALGISFEVVYFQGIPFLGLIGIGPSILYSEFGIHGFHGFVNALFFAGCIVQFTRIMLGGSKGWVLLGVVSVSYPVLVISRQVLVSLMLQYLIVYFSIKRPSPMVFVRAGILFLVTILIFGYVGDLRSGRDAIIQLGSPTFEYPEWLPSAFIWFYIYLCTPLNNVNYNIDITPNYFPLETAGTLIPSFARDAFMDAFGGRRQWDLVTQNLNVSSLLQSLLTDFGIIGSIVFTLLCGFCFSMLLRRANKSPGAFFAVVIILHGIALSFFANLLFQLVFIFEILAVTWILSRERGR
jgi:oligosaccharide repeat unit polymerase